MRVLNSHPCAGQDPTEDLHISGLDRSLAVAKLAVLLRPVPITIQFLASYIGSFESIVKRWLFPLIRGQRRCSQVDFDPRPNGSYADFELCSQADFDPLAHDTIKH